MESRDILTAFLQAWKNEDHEQMFEFSQKTWKDDRKPENIKAMFAVAKLKEHKVISSTYVSPSAMKYAVELTLVSGDKVISAIDVICEVAPNKPRPFGQWGVNPISVMNVVQKIPVKKAGPARTPGTRPGAKDPASKSKSNAKK